MAPITVKLAIERETKGAVRYQEVDGNGKVVDDDYAIGTLYVRKSALSEPYPQKLTVTIS